MSVSAQIQKFYKNEEGHTEYFIKVFYKGKQWAVRKRFSEFIQLDAFLRKDGIRVPLDLPQRTWWNRFDPNVLIQRKKDLQNYLDVLLTSVVPTDNSLIREFLDVDVKVLEMARKQSFGELTYSEKLNEIVRDMRISVIKASIAPIPQNSANSNVNSSSQPFSPLRKRGTSFSRRKKASFGTPTHNRHKNHSDSFDSMNSTEVSSNGVGNIISSSSSSWHHVSEVQSVLSDTMRKENFLFEIETNEEIQARIEAYHWMLDERILPRIDHTIGDVTNILSSQDHISKILTSILECEMDGFIEASPQNRIAFSGSKLLRHIRTSFPSSSLRKNSSNSSTPTGSISRSISSRSDSSNSLTPNRSRSSKN